jgi:hypothetical protein
MELQVLESVLGVVQVLGLAWISYDRLRANEPRRWENGSGCQRPHVVDDNRAPLS